jgi:hypothetical protein
MFYMQGSDIVHTYEIRSIETQLVEGLCITFFSPIVIWLQTASVCLWLSDVD